MPLVVPGSHAASNFENHISAKNNVSDVDSASDCEDTERRESDLLAPSSNKDPRRKKKLGKIIQRGFGGVLHDFCLVPKNDEQIWR